jgi:hypothetical protein
MSFLSLLPRAWVTIHIPGTGPCPSYQTYVDYPADRLPRVPENVDNFDWLAKADRHPESSMATPYPGAFCDISPENVADRLGGEVPADVRRFLAGDGLRERLQSATDCYFDLGDRVETVTGGRLMHLVSDSQWVRHWLLWAGTDGSSAVVSTSNPVGLNVSPDDDSPSPEDADFVLVADSFAEFIWRWWADNDIYYRIIVQKQGVSRADKTYISQYGPIIDSN